MIFISNKYINCMYRSLLQGHRKPGLEGCNPPGISVLPGRKRLSARQGGTQVKGLSSWEVRKPSRIAALAVWVPTSLVYRKVFACLSLSWIRRDIFLSSGPGKWRFKAREDQFCLSNCPRGTHGAPGQQHQEADVGVEETFWSSR